MDYCPIAEREDYKLGTMYNFYPGSCKVGLIEKEGLAEVMSDNSFCTFRQYFLRMKTKTIIVITKEEPAIQCFV